MDLSPLSALSTPHARRRAVEVALRLVAGTPLAPNAYEQELLDQFVQGDLTLDQLEYRMEVHRQDNPFL